MAKALWKAQSYPQAADKIREIIGRLLKTPGETRWNSLFDAMADLVELKEKLNPIMEALDLRKFTLEEIGFLEEYVRVSRPIAICLDTLQGDSSSLGMVLPTIVRLQKFMKERLDENSLQFCEPLAKYFLWDLTERTKEFFTDEDYIIGKLLYFNDE